MSEKSESMSTTDHFISEINEGYLTELSDLEIDRVRNSEYYVDAKHGHLKRAARITLSGRNSPILVMIPEKVSEGLIKFFTPTEPESSILVQTTSILFVYFSD